MARVVHFEIHAEQPERAVTFYSKLFGWEIKKAEGLEYWLITTGPEKEPGINGAIMRRRGTVDGTAVIGYVCTVDVKNIDESINKAGVCGGRVVVPKMAISGIGWVCYCKDTEGNIFGIMQADETAK